MDIIELLRSRITYDPESGALTWRRRDPQSFAPGKYPAERLAAIFNSAHAGKPALSCPSGKGYLAGAFDGKAMKAHRAAWAIHFGHMPDQIDHIDGDRTNNRIANLREVNATGNAKNKKLAGNNTSGEIGIHYRPKQKRKWVAQIGGASNRLHLGSFDTFDEARAARRGAALALNYHPNHGRR